MLPAIDRLRILGACCSLAFIASVIPLGAVAIAQPAPNWDWCLGKRNPTFEQRVAACTAIVESRGETPGNRAKALGFRAVAYSNNGNSQQALRDYEASL